MTDVDRLKADTFVIGADWKGKFDFLKDQCEVVLSGTDRRYLYDRSKIHVAKDFFYFGG